MGRAAGRLIRPRGRGRCRSISRRRWRPSRCMRPACRPRPARRRSPIVAVPKSGLHMRERLDEALETRARAVSLSAHHQPCRQPDNPRGVAARLRPFRRRPHAGDARRRTSERPFRWMGDLDGAPVRNLDGAEIIRGAGAGPYGAGALTGVIALDGSVRRARSLRPRRFRGRAGYDRVGGYGALGAEPIDLMVSAVRRARSRLDPGDPRPRRGG